MTFCNSAKISNNKNFKSNVKFMKFLHVGCGLKAKSSTTSGFDSDEWEEVRFDIDSRVNPDITGTMINMEGVESKSMDAIYSSHNIEHLYPHEVKLAFQEFFRVLKDGGFVMVTCPDLQSICELVAEDKLLEPAYNSVSGPIAPIDMLFGFRPSIAAGNLHMSHRTGFTQKSLADTFRGLGFESVASARRRSRFDLFCLASKEKLSQEELMSLAKKHFPGKN